MPFTLVKVGVLAVLLSTSAFAQEPRSDAPVRELGRWGPEFGPEAPSPIGAQIDWERQGRMARENLHAATWLAAHPGWRVLFDQGSRLPWRAYGPGLPVAPPGASEAQIRAAASVAAAELHEAFALPGETPRFRYAARAGRLWYVSFDQTFSGVRAEDAGMTLRIDKNGKLVMWGGRFVTADPAAVSPIFDEAEARAFAVAHLRSSNLTTASTRLADGPSTLVLHASIAGPSTVAGLAWRLSLLADTPHAEWVMYVDARSGYVREFWNDLRHAHGTAEASTDEEAPALLRMARARKNAAARRATFTATATGTVHENVLPTAAPVSMSFNDCRFLVDGAPVTTDVAGQFLFNGGPGSNLVTSGLDGIWINTNNVLGTQAAFSANVAPGSTTLAATFDDTNSLLEERDAFFFGTRARNNVLLHNPTETLFNAAITANVNVTGSCNAFYSPSAQTINFYPPAGSCINSAFSDTVVEHEYGHHVTTVIWNAHGRSVPGHLGEGFADAQAGSCEDQSAVGIGFTGPGTIIRDMNGTCQWPQSCGTSVHARGRIIGSSYWHTRVEFAAAFGAAGKVQMDQYLYQHFHGAPLTETESCLEFLLLDDDDADLSNATPNVAKFVTGFTTLHGVPFPLPAFEASHTPLGPTALAGYPYEVRATTQLTGLFPGAVTSGSLLYAIDGGSYASVPMNLLAGEWRGFIPAQASPAVITYFFAFSFAGGVPTPFPARAPFDVYTFRNYRAQSFFTDSFEAASGWTSAGTGQNDWHNQAPGNPNHAYDPATAFHGSKCWGNDLSIAGFNGNYANNVDNNLTSPIVDCTGKANVALDYRRWLTVEDALFDQASIELSIGGGPFSVVWQNVATVGGVTHHLDRSWVRHVVPLPTASGESNVRVRFRLKTDGGLVFGGWTIDDLRLDSKPAAPILGTTGATTAGAAMTFDVRGVNGEPFALAADILPISSYIPTVGTLGMDPLSATTLFLVLPGTSTIPPSGLFQLPLTVPGGLAGFSIVLQAVVIPLDASPLVVSEAPQVLFN